MDVQAKRRVDDREKPRPLGRGQALGCREREHPLPEGGVETSPSETKSALKAPGRSSGEPAVGEFIF